MIRTAHVFGDGGGQGGGPSAFERVAISASELKIYGVVSQALRSINGRGVTMAIPRQGWRPSKCWSPVTIDPASASRAHSSTWLSFGSGQSLTVHCGSTRHDMMVSREGIEPPTY